MTTTRMVLVRAAGLVVRRVPERLGQFRIANLFYRHLLSRMEGSSANAVLSDGSRFVLNIAEWPQAQAYLRRTYDSATVQFVVDHLPPNGVFLDVGAHVGLITFQVLRKAPSAKVHAFEPRPETANAFEEHLILNGGDVVLNRVGLSAVAGHLPFDPIHYKIHSAGDFTIPVLTLDEYLDLHRLNTVDVLKIDVEGHEESVLLGAKVALARHNIRALTLERMEGHGDTSGAARILNEHGYREVPMGPHSDGNVAYLP